ncbi:MAG: hypothetical protein IPK17_38350 [Chloroflexi bacterium]|uniref:hypothetical protein n=1 Tax=Candidatus Flexifilum breve TaxID=3140694 RepID=UPI003136A0D7|nr:hypothetical protein [Chloroflexota bacterium]
MPEERERIPFNVYSDELEKIDELRKDRGEKYITDYLRRLIEEDAERQGKPFKFRVDRGGYRRAKSSD